MASWTPTVTTQITLYYISRFFVTLTRLRAPESRASVQFAFESPGSGAEPGAGKSLRNAYWVMDEAKWLCVHIHAIGHWV